MGHAKEIITIDTYGDNKNIIADGIPEIEAYMDEVLPDSEQEQLFRQELLEIVVDISEYIPQKAQNKCLLESILLYAVMVYYGSKLMLYKSI